MKFSYVMLPDYPLTESLASIQLADELGFHAVYAADETWHKDLWLLFAAAAERTSSIRMGPSVSAVVLREPSLIAQATATLDELTGGRAEVVLSSGNFGLLAQYGMDWSTQKPLSRVKEGVGVIRTLLDEGTITHDGEFFTYNGLFTFARPVQQRVPVKMGAMAGPRSFRVAGEIADGCHHALGYTEQAYRYMYDNMRIGAERAGRDVDALDLGAWCVFAVGEDSATAKEAAKSMVGLYASAMPDSLLERNGVSPAEMKPILDKFVAGDLAGSIDATPDALAEKLSVAGTPQECIARIEEMKAGGANHMICAITDATLVKTFMGRDIPGIATVDEQLRLIAGQIMPRFA
ncbi:LLM class flavin-dependent oxidoreductase [Pseudonocardia sp. HH130630-07]|uniref:LLM class flavin-dependent oxidoreductase n=1 Tax=Pseudonocardia sp. HH130630-07 TaxID=1690815 RepID=UPI000815158C|nr:LLM class flavin-dependent oxidoreductase [Pseudonocardia sp. HH130630-07]ANY08074.1 5,10-methylene tetrahydromethanopterin reductase [Pseudonocardia sp. HH130630-07]